MIGLYTRWFHRYALLAGWAVGMAYGTWTASATPRSATRAATSAARSTTFPFTETLVYIGFTAFLLNLVVTVVLTVVLRALRCRPGVDQTVPADYHADLGDVGVEEELDPYTTSSHP